MIGRKTAEREVPPYTKLATIYDHVMRHVDYAHWTDYVETLFHQHRTYPGRLLDLACGTGSLALELCKRGYGVAGADASRSMVEVAEEKARAGGYDIAFHQKDLLDLSGLPRSDAVLCLYDSINYLMRVEEVAAALEQVRRVAVPGGVFIFDICTECNSLRHFQDMTDRDRGDGFSYTRHSYYDSGIQFNRFSIRVGATGELYHELHRQRIYPLADVERVLEASPFQVEGAYDGFSLLPATEESDRVHFVLRAG
jgi:ubiquinone/menaquinone biosynthesis C-methylase UbiE